MSTQLFNEIEQLNEKWMGYRYVIASTDTDLAGISLTSLGVTEIEFPTVEVQYREIPTLSTTQKFIPTRKVVGDLIIRAPIVKNAALFEHINTAAEALRGGENKSFSLIIGEYGNSAINAILGTPITIWFAIGCQPKMFKTANANSNYTGDIPLEELTLKVTDFYRPVL